MRNVPPISLQLGSSMMVYQGRSWWQYTSQSQW